LTLLAQLPFQVEALASSCQITQKHTDPEEVVERIAMAGTVILTGANSSLGIHAVEHLLSTYPKYTAILTVRNDSETDTNTGQVRSIIARFPNAKASIHALDLSSLPAVHAFADQIKSDIASAKYPALVAIIANAYYWNLIDDPEITADGYDKTIQVTHIAHSALILRLLGSFGDKGRIVLLSSDSHWPGKNPMERYPPTIPDDPDELLKPTTDADKQGRGYQRYASAKLAITTWLYPLNKYLQQVSFSTKPVRFF
jgi:NAD(P)-dependent dehydrogenase (short-subunit alcohol dehydrogenase family)